MEFAIFLIACFAKDFWYLWVPPLAVAIGLTAWKGWWWTLLVVCVWCLILAAVGWNMLDQGMH